MVGDLIFFRDTSVTNTPESVVATTGGDSCTVRAWNIINTNDFPVYLKFYNIASGSVTVGTSTVTGTLLVPVGGCIENLTEGTQDDAAGGRYLHFNTALSIACTKNLADSDNTSATGIYVELQIQRI